MNNEMINLWFGLKPQERIEIFTETGNRMGLPASAVEKDWWVTAALGIVFSLPYGNHMAFKGGTSLSKGWNLIERFSEDIDLAIDRSSLGFDGPMSKSRVKQLRKSSCAFISGEFLSALISKSIEAALPFVSIAVQKFKDTDTDPLVIELGYNSLTSDAPYLKPRVLIEIGARSMMEPCEDIAIQSFIGSHFSDKEFADNPFIVPTVLPKRTFLEKAFLLHEEFQKPVAKIRIDRLSRHLYDLDRLSGTIHCEEALSDFPLYQSIIEHRERFNLVRGINYANHLPDKIRFVPPPEVLKIWEADYSSMKESMIFGKSKEFNDLITSIENLNKRFNAIKF